MFLSDDYLAHCQKIGKVPQKLYSGKVMLRLNPEPHARLAKAAELKPYQCINEFAEDVLNQATADTH